MRAQARARAASRGCAKDEQRDRSSAATRGPLQPSACRPPRSATAAMKSHARALDDVAVLAVIVEALRDLHAVPLTRSHSAVFRSTPLAVAVAGAARIGGCWTGTGRDHHGLQLRAGGATRRRHAVWARRSRHPLQWRTGLGGNVLSGNGNARQQGLSGNGSSEEPRVHRASDECGVPSTHSHAGCGPVPDRGPRTAQCAAQQCYGRTLGRRPLSAAPSLRFPSFATTCEQTNT